MNTTVNDQDAGRERTPIGNDDECGCPVYAAPEIRGDDADTLVEHGGGCPLFVVDPAARPDDGPGYDQHGNHNSPTPAQRIADALQRRVDAGGPPAAAPDPSSASFYVDPREMLGLPAPEAPAIAAEVAEHSLLTAKEDEALDTRVQGLLRDRELGYASRRTTSQKIIAAVRGHDRRASHEGATVSAAIQYTGRLTLHADDLDVPPTGPRWQVVDAKDEETWHDLTGLVECGEPDCTISIDDEIECVVLRSAAYADGFGHYPADAMVDVRIPAGDR